VEEGIEMAQRHSNLLVVLQLRIRESKFITATACVIRLGLTRVTPRAGSTGMEFRNE
jgi:hypothetical protein